MQQSNWNALITELYISSDTFLVLFAFQSQDVALKNPNIRVKILQRTESVQLSW